MVLIVGSGLAGATLAIRLNQLGIACKLFDKIAFDSEIPRDGRTIAVTYGSKQFLETCGLWQKLEKSAQPINHIRVLEHGSAWTVDYDAKDIGANPMGYIIEFDQLRDALIDALKQAQNVKIFSPTTITKINQSDTAVIIATKEHGQIKGSLLVGADGKNSWVRSQVNIKSQTKEYGHKALVAHFSHEKPHNDNAWEVFHQSGPFAMLPMPDCENGEHQSGIVWCGPKNAPWETLTDEELQNNLQEIFPYYGRVKINSKRWTFPITALSVDKVFDKRVVLVGDSAHALHPIAGQGINLGWRDVRILADLISEAVDLGQDYGSQTFLRKYSRKRKIDHKSLFLFTHLVTKLFEIDSSLVSMVRQTGFAVVNKLGPLKRYFMKRAISGV